MGPENTLKALASTKANIFPCSSDKEAAKSLKNTDDFFSYVKFNCYSSKESSGDSSEEPSEVSLKDTRFKRRPAIVTSHCLIVTF